MKLVVQHERDDEPTYIVDKDNDDDVWAAFPHRIPHEKRRAMAQLICDHQMLFLNRPGGIDCPKCKSANRVYFQEMVEVGYSVTVSDDEPETLDVDSGSRFQPDGTEPRCAEWLWCRDCSAEFPLPTGYQVEWK